MTSQVYWSLLGLVIVRPGHGYDLMKRFESTYGHVLQLSSYSQIYGALDKLEERGLIEEITKPGAARSGTSRQPKRPYQATEEGRRSYRERMFEQAGEDRRQMELFVRQLAVFEHEPDVASEILDHHETSLLREARQAPCKEKGLVGRLLHEARRQPMEGRLMWIEFARSEFTDGRRGGRT